MRNRPRKKLRFGGTSEIWLRELKCFSGIEDEDLIEKLLAVAHVERFPEGAIIVKNGVADALRIIVEGTVELLVDDEIEPTVLVDGEYFGFSMALGTSLHTEASEARALSAVEVHILHDEDLQVLVNQRKSTRCAWGVEKPVSGRPCTPCSTQLSTVGGLLSARLSTPWQPPSSAYSMGDEPTTPGDNDKPAFDAWSWGWGEPSAAWGTPRFPDDEEKEEKPKSSGKQRKVRRPRQLCDVPPMESLREDLENLPDFPPDCTWPVLGGSPTKLPGSFGMAASPNTARDEQFFQPASARYPMSPIKSPIKTPHRGLMSPAKMSHRRRRACA